MEFVLSIVIATIFIFLALLHFFWLLGGHWGMAVAVPTDLNGRRIFNPTRIGTLLVAIGLLIFAFVNLCAIGVLDVPIDAKYIRYGMYMISGIFLLRFIGDMKFVGIFKKYRKSSFAIRDTYFYSPLCLFLSVSNGFLAFVL
ncbi:DUF3995 domain-containing protein [Sphingobacterium siyangense]|uniref:DUF3995 domain-containing protein n=1 Tax=Sphingobacterium siyangense TaxID=459529 RepID=UPI0019647BC5|nr:DUF3995 domain-containing protein [Sphingobacterium siyangense]QRY56257.1 DUF3995 domain-containing protein [Sphingobacterium siyangense]